MEGQIANEEILLKTEYKLDNDLKDDKDARLIETIRKLKNNSSLTKLNLMGCVIYNEGAQFLAEWLDRITTLRSLSFWYCEFNLESLLLISSALAKNTSLTDLALISYMALKSSLIKSFDGFSTNLSLFIKRTALKELRIENIAINVEVAKTIGNSLKHFDSLTTLVLIRMKLALESIHVISKGLKRNSSLRELKLNETNIKDDGAKHIADSLRQNNALTALNLQVNKIGPEGAQMTAESLRMNTSLVSLNLGYNSIGSKGAVSIADAVKLSSSLRKLDLTGNGIKNEGALAMAEMIEENTNLNELHLANNSLTEHEIAVVKESVKLNGTLKKLWLSNKAEKSSSMDTKDIAHLFVDHDYKAVIKAHAKSKAEKSWYRQMIMPNQSILGLSLLIAKLKEDIEHIENSSTKSTTPVMICLKSATFQIVHAVINNLQRPHILLGLQDFVKESKEYETLFPLITRIYELEGIRFVLLIEDIASGSSLELKSKLLMKLKSMNINPKALLILCTSSHGTNVMDPLFDGIVQCSLSDSALVHEYLIVLLKEYEHSLTKKEVRSLAERLAGYSNIVGQCITPADVSAIVVQSFVLKSMTSDQPVNLADINDVMKHSMLTRGEPKSLKTLLTDAQDITKRFDIILQQKRIRVTCLCQRLIGSIVNFGKLNEMIHYEVLKQIESIEVAPKKIHFNYLLFNGKQWRLGRHHLIEINPGYPLNKDPCMDL